MSSYFTVRGAFPFLKFGSVFNAGDKMRFKLNLSTKLQTMGFSKTVPRVGEICRDIKIWASLIF
jgi:hypothetical protein